jgi:hypothetical protein
LPYRDSGAADGVTDPVVLLAHDDFGVAVVEALFNRADCPADSFFAFRGTPRANAPEAFDWTRYEGAGRWRPLRTPDRRNAAQVLYSVIRHELGPRFNSRVDIFLLTAALRDKKRADCWPLADTIWQARQLFDDLGRVCTIVAAPASDAHNWPADLAGNADAANLFGDLLKIYDFDFVFLAHEFTEAGLLDSEASGTILAGSATITVLTFQPLARLLKERLDTGQLDLRRRAISMSVASLNVDGVAIQGQVRSALARRLINDLLERIDNAAAESADLADVDTAQNASQLMDAAGWNVAAFKRHSARYRDRLAAREQEILRDLIDDAGEAAKAFANTRLKRAAAPAPAVRRQSSPLPVLVWLFGAGGVLAAIGAILMAGITDKLAIGGPEATAAVLAITSVLMIVTSVVLALIFRSRSGGADHDAAPDHPRTVPSDKYLALRELQRQLRVESNATTVWERNVERSRQSIQADLKKEIEWKRLGLKVPDAIYIKLLSTRGNLASVDDFVRHQPHGVKLLAAEDHDAALKSLMEYADAFLSRIGVFGWPELLHQLADPVDGGLQWLMHTLQQMRRTSGRPAVAPEQGNWEIVALPEATPASLADAMRAVFPGRDALLCVTADEFTIVHARIIELPGDPLASSALSPL